MERQAARQDGARTGRRSASLAIFIFPLVRLLREGGSTRSSRQAVPEIKIITLAQNDVRPCARLRDLCRSRSVRYSGLSTSPRTCGPFLMSSWSSTFLL